VLRHTGEPDITAKEHNMKIAVAGATGRLGRHVVEVLTERGHQVVAMSRATGVDVITGSGLEAALDGAEVIVDAATSPSPEEQTATEFFVTAARNLQQAGVRAGARRAVVVSIISIDRFTGGYGAAKIADEDAWRSGPIPVWIVRAAQFHQFVAQLLDWGTRDHAPAERVVHPGRGGGCGACQRFRGIGGVSCAHGSVRTVECTTSTIDGFLSIDG
jgi:uncharacterized protein YbjT (DUF2867 family)